jgi:hypothetical protein
MDMLNLNSFLKMGYFLKFNNPAYTIDLSQVDKTLYLDYSEDELLQMGVKLFKRSINENFESNRKHLVPISGGFDSRAILTTLLEFTEAHRIQTLTYGTPGTFDFEFGNLVAQKVGSKHTSLPMSESRYRMEELIDLSKRFQYQTVLFYHPPIWEIEKKFNDHLIWSGFTGGPTTGSATPKEPAENIEIAKQRFMIRRPLKSMSLTNCPDSDFYPLIDWDGFSHTHLSYEEQLDFKNRQLKFISPHLLCKGFQYKTPFLHHNFMNFMLSLPDKYRRDQYLFQKMMLMNNPKIFSLRTKKTGGLPVKAGRFRRRGRQMKLKVKKEINKIVPLFTDPSLNYIDFNRGIREREDLRSIIYENVMDIKNRKIIDWINIEEIWRKHLSKTADHADALINLASLELHLKAGKKRI